jgi:hypothetical protein
MERYLLGMSYAAGVVKLLAFTYLIEKILDVSFSIFHAFFRFCQLVHIF